VTDRVLKYKLAILTQTALVANLCSDANPRLSMARENALDWFQSLLL
jgi:hypothetical protein